MKNMMLCAPLDLGVTGGQMWDPTASMSPEPGVYEAKVTAVDPNYNGGKSTKFTVDLLVGPSAGMQTDLYLGNESTGDKHANEKKWLAALVAVAPSKEAGEKFIAAAKAGKLPFDPAKNAAPSFLNKKIHVLVTAVPGKDEQGRDHLPNKEFITADKYATMKESGVMPKASAPKGTNGSAGTQTPAATPPAAAEDPLATLFPT